MGVITLQNLVVDFLLHRSSGKSVLLEYCSKLALDSIEEVTSNVDKPLNYKFDGYGLNQRLDQFAFVFKRICEVGYCGTNVMSKLLTDSDRKMPSASEASCHCSIVVSDALNLMWINTFLLPILRRLYLNHIQLLHIFLYCTDLIHVVSSHISHYLKYIRNKTYDPKSFTGDEWKNRHFTCGQLHIFQILQMKLLNKHQSHSLYLFFIHISSLMIIVWWVFIKCHSW